MSTSHRSSSVSASCRLEWRPSRLIAHWLAALAVLAPICLLASAMPRGLAWPLALVVCVFALRERRAYRKLKPLHLHVRAEGPLQVEGAAHARWRLRWRGPFAFIEWKDEAGRRQALAFWPDTLDAATRRELKLATPATGSVSPAVGMAT